MFSPSRLDNGGFFPRLPGMSFDNQPLVIAGRSFRSRLIFDLPDTGRRVFYFYEQR
jgi:predicted ester cyclase